MKALRTSVPVFTRDIESPGSAARVVFDDAESSQIVATRGSRLFERYWGRYVAILRNAVTGEVWVLRDPSGGFPCWLTSHDGVSIVFSDIDDCHALGGLSFTVNWNYITRFVAHAGLQVRDVIVFLDREQGGKEKLEKEGYRVHSVFTIREMLNLLCEAGKISAEQRGTVLSFLEETINA